MEFGLNILIYLKTILIDFYGNNNKLFESEQIFESNNSNKKDIICVCAMMTAYINNNPN